MPEHVNMLLKIYCRSAIKTPPERPSSSWVLFVAVRFGPPRSPRRSGPIPPSGKLKPHEPHAVPPGASIVYEWAGNPGTKAGTIHAFIEEGKIVRMVIYFDLV